MTVFSAAVFPFHFWDRQAGRQVLVMPVPEKQTDVNGKKWKEKESEQKSRDGVKINNEHVMPSILLGRFIH